MFKNYDLDNIWIVLRYVLGRDIILFYGYLIEVEVNVFEIRFLKICIKIKYEKLKIRVNNLI